jgi:uncharacterized membrane protein (DUF485 family)
MRFSTFSFQLSTLFFVQLPRPQSFAIVAPVPMPIKISPKPDMHSEAFLHSLMRKQLKLSIACALAFMVVLLGLPLANYFAPDFMATRVGGFTLTWLVLGIAFFPAVWCIAFYFIRRSIRLEEEEVREVQPSEKQL